MQNNDELVTKESQNLKRKSVTFPADLFQDDRLLTPHHKMQTKLNFSFMKKKVMLFLNEGKIEEANEYLKSYTPKQIREFFLNKGGVFFRWAINYCANFEPLVFLIDIVQKELTEEILSQDNFSILVCFFGSQSMLDQDGLYNKDREDNATKKITILLSLNSAKINKFIEEEIVGKDLITKEVKITENVRKSVQAAKLSIKIN